MYILVRKYGFINTSLQTRKDFDGLYEKQNPKPTKVQFIDFIISEFSKLQKQKDCEN